MQVMVAAGGACMWDRKLGGWSVGEGRLRVVSSPARNTKSNRGAGPGPSCSGRMDRSFMRGSTNNAANWMESRMVERLTVGDELCVDWRKERGGQGRCRSEGAVRLHLRSKSRSKEASAVE